MACIDIYAPSRCLTVVFLAEQIWLRARGKRLLATEVYDFLLRVDDDQDLNSFFVGSPHFCRKRLPSGEWKDNVRFLSIGGAKTQWGWFYLNERKEDIGANDGRILALRVPNTTADSEPEVLDMKGEYLVEKSITWHEDLQDSTTVELMREIKKSLYHVTLDKDKPLLKRGGNQMWFRLLVEPVELDILNPVSKAPDSFVDWILPKVNLTAKVTCPINVRRSLPTPIDKLRREYPNDGVQVGRLQEVLITEGIDKQGTSTRIEEHRIMLAADGVELDVQGATTPRIVRTGPQLLKCELPPFEHDYAPAKDPTGAKVQAVVHHWSGGSTQNGEVDLVSVACAYMEEAAVSPKPLPDLVQTTTPRKFREGCFLAHKMVKIGLLSIDDKEVCQCPALSNADYADKMCELRRMWQNAATFTAFPLARQSFTDLHAFIIDFVATWAVCPRLRMAVFGTLAASTIVALVLSIINFWRCS